MEYKYLRGVCSVFDGVRNGVLMDLSVHGILTLIKRQHYQIEISRLRSCNCAKLRSDTKSSLLSFTPAGTFKDVRGYDKILSLSGIAVLDFDDLTNISLAKERIVREPCTLACFISPSGGGLKVLVRTDAKSIPEYTTAYNKMASFYSRVIAKGLDRADDITRLCFLSSDPELYWDPKALTIEECLNFL